MPIRLPDPILNKSAGAILKAAFALLFFCASTFMLMIAADAHLRCDRTADRCDVQRAGWFGTAETSWRVRDITDTWLFHPPKTGTSLKIDIFADGRRWTESFDLDGPVASQADANFDDLRAGKINEVEINAPGRSTYSIVAAMMLAVGTGLAVLAYREWSARLQPAPA